ncbi:Ras GTPase [Mortierella sp. AD011]|nr:Ras GTPase [Mortierella sp. AD010]KAF9399251.1 Ras GTPase [Mortierella sp. AD011]
MITVYKIVVVGGGGVGKTALINQFNLNSFVTVYDPVIGELYRKQCVIDDKVALVETEELFDWEDYRSVAEFYIRNGEGFMFVYSTTSRKSFDEISSLYQEVLQIKGDIPFCVVLVGTKSDLHQERQVTAQDGHELAKRFHCRFIEASSKTAVNVDKSFYGLAREIRSSKEAQSKSDNPTDKSGVSGCHCLVL